MDREQADARLICELRARVEELEAELIMIFGKVEYSLNELGLKGG